ncbi:MAG: xanthine dehydrogenase family protein molybdopterin-binding subunit, partial [Candidatus Eremiobacteraeota bacterium]|nr:xanthine dehydrogenase family protein molybdopterin-binding subunit [Candidatus Eremiobacteraeota bacterium]
MIGQRVARKEDPRLLRGQGQFVDDIRLAGTLHAAFLRSPVAHARITRLDTGKAWASPGVAVVLTGADLPPYPLPVAPAVEGMVIPEQPMMAREKVHYVGERVAVVVAASRAQALDACAAIEVEYEDLPVVTDPVGALAVGSPLVHQGLESNLSYVWACPGGPPPEGDWLVEKVRLEVPRVAPMPLEGRAVLASFDAGRQEMTVWCSHQRPHLLRDILARQTQLSDRQLRVIAPDVGGAFGCKVNVYGEEAIVANLARQLGKPVKWTEGRREHFVSTSHGRGQVAELEARFDKDGKVGSLVCHIVVDLGAFHQFLSAAIPPLTGMMMSGPYQIGHLDVEVRGVFTNKTPTDAYRGAGKPEATYYLERLMDRIAGRLELDPAEVRRRNFITTFPYPAPTRLFYDSGNYVQCLDKALEMVGYAEFRQRQKQARQGGKLLGLGLSSYVEVAGVGPSFIIPGGGWEMATVRLERGGGVTVLTGISPHGQGQQTTFAQLVREVLDVPMDQITVRHGDTGQIAAGIGTFGSRGTTLGGTALMMALEKLKAKVEAISQALGGAELAQVVEAAYNARGLPEGMEPGLEATAYYDPANFVFPFGTHLAVVEVEVATGDWKVIRYIAVDDCGRVINPMLVEGQVHGGVAQGLGQVLCEGPVYDRHGQLRNPNLGAYGVVRAADLPTIETAHFETLSPVNPLGIKGVGEAGAVASPPAVVNALADALAHFDPPELVMPVRP